MHSLWRKKYGWKTKRMHVWKICLNYYKIIIFNEFADDLVVAVVCTR